MQIEEIIHSAKELLARNGIDREFGNVSKIYPFTTEHIRNYLIDENIEGKSVLTVSGSGDHILNLMSLNSGKIIGFDVNQLSMLYTEIKIIAAQSLSYEDYLFFFSLGTDFCWNKDTYTILREKLSSKALSFFDFLYKNITGVSLRLLPIFYQEPIVDQKIQEYNFYLHSASCYKNVGNWRGHYSWINSSIDTLDETLDKNERFDFILLSNIMDYAKYIYQAETYNEEFIDNILIPLTKRLNTGGKIFATCLFDLAKREEENNELVKEEFWNSVLKKEEILINTMVYSSAITGKNDMSIILSKSA